MRQGIKEKLINDMFDKEKSLTHGQTMEIFGDDFDSPFNIEETENQETERRRTIKSFRGSEST